VRFYFRPNPVQLKKSEVNVASRAKAKHAAMIAAKLEHVEEVITSPSEGNIVLC